MSFISFRQLLNGHMHDFVNGLNVRLDKPKLQEVLIQLVEQLKSYKDEGRDYFPEVYLVNTESFKTFRGIVGSANFIDVGEADFNASGARFFLKKLGSLTSENWKLYVSVDGDKFKFGLFSPDLERVSGFVHSRLLEIDPNDAPEVLILRRLSDGVVEISATAEMKIEIAFSLNQTSVNYTKTVESFLKKSFRSVDKENLDQVVNACAFTVSAAISDRHGFLLAVVPSSFDSKSLEFRDGIFLKSPLDISEKIRSYHITSSALNYSCLCDSLELLRNMLSSDGITVLNESGLVLGYSIFVKSDDGEGIPGGARTRAFEALSKLVDKQLLVSAFMLSQDGAVKVKL